MKQLILIAFVLQVANQAMAQGCSDAGFCSLGALKETNIMEEGKRRLDLGTNTGIGEQHTFTINPYIQYHTTINKHLSLLGKITATYAHGFLGSKFQVGDFYGLATYTFNEGLRLLTGIKIPFTTANATTAEGRGLPLDYQSSLGTYDVVLGFSYIYKRHWEWNAALQAPVIQVNKNTFPPDDYTDSRVQHFAPTNLFRRRSDVLLRAGYYLSLGKSITVKPNLLAIYHIGEDTYQTPSGIRTAIDGSRGFTLNGALSFVKQFGNSTRLELIAATPFITRKVRADGLTRSAVLNVQYSLFF